MFSQFISQKVGYVELKEEKEIDLEAEIEYDEFRERIEKAQMWRIYGMNEKELKDKEKE